MDGLKMLYPPPPSSGEAEDGDGEVALRLHRALNARPARQRRGGAEAAAGAEEEEEEEEEVKISLLEMAAVKAEPEEDVKVRLVAEGAEGEAGPSAAGGGQRRGVKREREEEAGPSGRGASAGGQQPGRVGAKSRFRGVSKDKNAKAKPWKAEISFTEDGKRRRIGIGTFAREKDAARAYDRVSIAKLGHAEAVTNFPVAEYRAEWAELEALGVNGAAELMRQHAKAERAEVMNKASRFQGVSKSKGGKGAKPWAAYIDITEDGKRRLIHIGYFAREEDAARAFDRVNIAKLGHAEAKTNFPVAEYRAECAELEALGVDAAVALMREHAEAERAEAMNKASRFRGVTKDNDAKARPWVAKITVTEDGKGRSINIALFAREEDAARAYDRVSIAKLGHAEARTNFPVADYRAEWAELEALGVDGAVALMKEQAAAERREAMASRFRGVTKLKGKAKPWAASIRVTEDGKHRRIHIAYFAQEEDAARAFDRANIAKLGHVEARTNFPVAEYRAEWAELEALGVEGAVALVREHAAAERLNRMSSRFRGVSKVKGAEAKPWRAEINVTEEGKRRCISIGYYAREEDAARAFDCVNIAAKGHAEAKTNFPAAEYRAEWAKLEAMGVDGAVARERQRAQLFTAI